MNTDNIISMVSGLSAAYFQIPEEVILTACIVAESNKMIADAIDKHADVMIDIRDSMEYIGAKANK